MTTFSQLGLSSQTLQVITEKGFSSPSEIQRKAIPILLQNSHDFIGLAPTGTGKTGAFGWPLLELVDASLDFTQALILTPTRELGQQVASELFSFSKYHEDLRVLCVYGGAPISGQLKSLRKTRQIIIATPGRLLDLVRRNAVDLSTISYLVLDEADEMLNMGFQEEIDQIIQETPSTRSTWLFSATMSKEIRGMIRKYMHAPKEVKLEGLIEGNSNIEHQYSIVTKGNKIPALMRFIDDNPGLKAVVFCKTRIETQEVADLLLQRNYLADALHGDLQQNQRDRVMKSFRKGEIQILVATDVAARGIDVPDISHVFHVALPDDLAYYTHRSGRTARAGKTGISLVILTNKEMYRLNRMAKNLSLEFSKVDVPLHSEVMKRKVQSWCLQILHQQSKGILEKDLREYGQMLLHNLSKEEIIDKMLAWELQAVQHEVQEDYNERGSVTGDRSDKRSRSRGGRRFQAKSSKPHRKGNRNDRGRKSPKRFKKTKK